MDVLTLGNAMVDVLALVTDEQLAELGLEKNVWGLLDAEEAQRLYDAMPAGVEVSGGSAANTAIGVASSRRFNFGSRGAPLVVYLIGVAAVWAVVLGLAWFIGGSARLDLVAMVCFGFAVGMLAMYMALHVYNP